MYLYEGRDCLGVVRSSNVKGVQEASDRICNCIILFIRTLVRCNIPYIYIYTSKSPISLGSKSLLGSLPVDHIPNSGEVLGLAVLVLEVVLVTS